MTEEEGQGLALSEARMGYKIPIIKTGLPEFSSKSSASITTLACVFSFHDGPP